MFNINQPIFADDEIDEKAMDEYIDELVDVFYASPEGQPHVAQFGRSNYSGMFLEYAFNYLGIPLPEISQREAREVLFDIIPRKVSIGAENAPAIVSELHAFFSFIHREYRLSHAKKIVALLDSGAEKRLHEALSDPSKFGMAKSFMMQGMEAGYDMTSQEGADAFVQEFNRRLMEGQNPPNLPMNPFFSEPIIGFGGGDFRPLLSSRVRAEKRRKAKAQRQARKKNRK